MAKESKKTKQIGVRFDKDLLEGVVKGDLARSPQMALNLYEKSYIELVELKVKNNNEPENKDRIENEREASTEAAQEAEYPLDEKSVEPPKEESRVAKMMREKREQFLKNKLSWKKNQNTSQTKW